MLDYIEYVAQVRRYLGILFVEICLFNVVVRCINKYLLRVEAVVLNRCHQQVAVVSKQAIEEQIIVVVSKLWLFLSRLLKSRRICGGVVKQINAFFGSPSKCEASSRSKAIYRMYYAYNLIILRHLLDQTFFSTARARKSC